MVELVVRGVSAEKNTHFDYHISLWRRHAYDIPICGCWKYNVKSMEKYHLLKQVIMVGSESLVVPWKGWQSEYGVRTCTTYYILFLTIIVSLRRHFLYRRCRTCYRGRKLNLSWRGLWDRHVFIRRTAVAGLFVWPANKYAIRCSPAPTALAESQVSPLSQSLSQWIGGPPYAKRGAESGANR